MTFEELWKRTLELNEIYTTDIGRYKLVTPKSGTAVNPLQTLEQLIGRINDYVISCKTDRKDELDAITKLTDELRQIKDGSDNELEIKTAVLFLSGALLHRLLRIIYECELKNGLAAYVRLPWMEPMRVQEPTDSSLYTAICDVFELHYRQLSPESKKLDVVTIVGALKVFRENMYGIIDTTETSGAIKRAVRKPKYMTYDKYIAQEAESPGSFQTDLDKMIHDLSRIDAGAPDMASHFLVSKHYKYIFKHTTEKDVFKSLIYRANLLKQFSAIAFIQSLAKQLHAENTQIEDALKGWCTALQRAHKDFSKLTPELMLTHLDTHFARDLNMGLEVKSLLKKQFIRNYLADTAVPPDHATFAGKMRECNLGVKFNILRGGYYLLLECPGEIKPDLIALLKKAIEVDDAVSLSREDLVKMLRFVQQYMKETPSAALHYSFWGERQTVIAILDRLVPAPVAASTSTLVVQSKKEDSAEFTLVPF